MAGDTPAEAVAAFLRRVRSTLSCLNSATVYASRSVSGVPRSLVIFAEGQRAPDRVLLPTHGGSGDLVFHIAHQFMIQRTLDIGTRETHSIVTSFYQYRILDYQENEIAVYHWHPTGKSSVTHPHLHVSAAGSIELRQRIGSKLASRKTHLGRVHFQTRQILLEDVVELLIREFSVDPRHSDWQRIVQENRDAVLRAGIH